jgi:hypothetical protein
MKPAFRSRPRPGIAYGQIRDSICNGDVLMYRGRSLSSRIIQWATGSKYSHAGVAAWWNERLMVLEAVGRGVIATPLSINVAEYHGDVELYTSVPVIPEDSRRRMIQFAQEELGKEYATWATLWLGVRILLQRHIDRRDALRRERKLFCSFYVAQVYNAGGFDLKRGVSDRFMSPRDIASSPLLRVVGPLRRGPAAGGV